MKHIILGLFVTLLLTPAALSQHRQGPRKAHKPEVRSEVLHKEVAALKKEVAMLKREIAQLKKAKRPQVRMPLKREAIKKHMRGRRDRVQRRRR
jgi:cell division protein FtsB